MQLSSWIYPWDVAALGAGAVVDEARAAGLDALELAGTYHAISAVSPRPAGRRLFYTASGGVFFPARQDRYGRIQPELWTEPEVLAAWPRLVDRAGRSGLTVNGWMIGSFQPWMTQRYPEVARRMATGDPVWSLVCPSSTDVKEYLIALCADLADQFEPPLVHLEGIAQPDYDYGWVRPRVLASLSPSTAWLLGQCFCDACCRLGTAVGIDVAALRNRVSERLARSLSNPEEKPDPALLLDEDPELRSLVALRNESTIGLIGEIATAVRRASRSTRVGVWSPLDVEESDGVDLERVVDRIGSTLVWSPAAFPAEAARARRLADSAAGKVQLTHLQVCGGRSPVGSPEFRDELDAALRVPVDRIALYNFGLLTESQLGEAAALVRQGASNPVP